MLPPLPLLSLAGPGAGDKPAGDPADPAAMAGFEALLAALRAPAAALPDSAGGAAAGGAGLPGGGKTLPAAGATLAGPGALPAGHELPALAAPVATSSPPGSLSERAASPVDPLALAGIGAGQAEAESAADAEGITPAAAPAPRAVEILTAGTPARPDDAGALAAPASAGAAPAASAVAAAAGLHHALRALEGPEGTSAPAAGLEAAPEARADDTGRAPSPAAALARGDAAPLPPGLAVRGLAETPEAGLPHGQDGGDLAIDPGRFAVEPAAPGEAREALTALARAAGTLVTTSAQAPAAAQAPVPAPATMPLAIDVPPGADGWGDALGDRVLVLAGQRIRHADIQLHPAELGPVRVHLSVDDGTASVSFHASHPLTRDAIEQSLPRLRELLGQQGLSLGDASVSDHPPAPDQQTPERGHGEWRAAAPAAEWRIDRADDSPVPAARTLAPGLVNLFA